MTRTLLITCFLLSTLCAFSQSKDSAALARRDSIRMAKMLESAVYPLIKGAQWAGVIPVENPDEVPDPKLQYKVMMEFTNAPGKGKAVNDINPSLTEIARVINIHIAAGIPLKNLHFVVVAHGPSLYSLMTDELYQKKYNHANPNLKLIEDLKNAGVVFTVCGQAMKFLDLEKSSFLPVVRVAYSAKVVFTSYAMKGYTKMSADD